MKNIITLFVCILVISSIFSGIGVVNAQNNSNGVNSVGELVFVATDNSIEAYDTNGNIFWSIDKSNVSEIDISENGQQLFIAFDNGDLESLNPATGSLIWENNVVDNPNDYDYITPDTENNYIYVISDNSEIRKIYQSNGSIHSTNSVSSTNFNDIASTSYISNNELFVVDRNGRYGRYDYETNTFIWSFDATGTTRFERVYTTNSNDLVTFATRPDLGTHAGDHESYDGSNGNTIEFSTSSSFEDGAIYNPNTGDYLQVNGGFMERNTAPNLMDAPPQIFNVDGEHISTSVINTSHIFTLTDSKLQIYNEQAESLSNINISNGIDTTSIWKYTKEESDIETPDKQLTLKADTFMTPGSEQSYVVDYSDAFSNGEVTNNATVLSNDPSIIEVDENNNSFIANNSGTAEILVEYQDENTTVDITVAPLTINNIEDMPSSYWVHAVLGIGENNLGIGSEIQWVLLTVLLGATAANISRNEWLGNGVIIAQLILYWVMGNISLGLVLTGVFYGIFITLYIRQIPSRTVLNMPDNQGGNGGFE